MRKSVEAFVLAVGLLMSALGAQIRVSFAQNGIVLSKWATRTPTIDGYLAPTLLQGPNLPKFPPTIPKPLPYPKKLKVPSEWGDAARVDFTLTYGSDSHPATLWVKNDYINLYLAVEITNEEYNDGDILSFNFDNNHNGVMETGDDHLGLGFSNQFTDWYFNADGSTDLDTQYGGTSDGAGSAAYSTALSKWVFEVVHPLNTYDDAHDFSLTIGSVVGVMMWYSDSSGNNGLGIWPASFPYDWDQMADIVIAGPPTPPPPAYYVDLTISGVEVVQAVQYEDNSLPLVRDKVTVVRVYVDIGGEYTPPSVRVNVFLYGTIGRGGSSLGALDRSFDAPEIAPAIARKSAASSANFVLPMSWVSGESLALKAFVKAYYPETPGSVETAYNNNWMAEREFSLTATKTLNVHIIPINAVNLTPSQPTSREIREQEEYMRAIYPVAKINFIEHWELVTNWNGNVGGDLSSLEPILESYAINLGVSSPDQVFGLLPTVAGTGGVSWPTYWDSGLGLAACGSRGGSTSLEGLIAHEINHNLGPYDGKGGWGGHTPSVDAYPDAYWPYSDHAAISEYGTTIAWGSIQVMPPTTPDIESYSQSGTFPTKWISPYRWIGLLSLLQIPPLSPSARMESTFQGITNSEVDCLEISGWIGKNGTGSLAPIFRLLAKPLQPTVSGSATVELQDASGDTLLVKSFQPTFNDVDGRVLDVNYFTMCLPYQDGTAKVVLKNDSQTLDTVIKSEHAPVVNVLSPKGGEIWNATGVQTISWTGNDSDGDALTYRVFYSADNGTSWAPISPSITKTTYETSTLQINASYIKASNGARICVVATDGFNVVRALSNAVITVMNHPPTAEIISPSETDLWLMGSTIPLTAIDTDPDETLPESAYSWTSDLDGFLGHGSYLPVVLSMAQVHHVTLTVTDSNGVNATDTTQVLFYTKIEVGYPPQTGFYLNQTAVGQGFTAKIRILVSNLGSNTESFDVNALADGDLFQTIPILDLPSGNSTSLELLWNTTGKPKGVYNITATITLPEYEITQLLDTIQIAGIGDITGSTAGVPDGKVNMVDIANIARLFTVRYPDPKYNPNCDLSGTTLGVPDGNINIIDITIAAKNFGKTYS